MNILINAKIFDQIGLIFGFISGLLLIPEIINLFPLAKLEEIIESQLYKLSNWLKFPLRFSPPSWKYKLTENQRESIEAPTAIRSLVFSIIWISILIIGIVFSYTFLVLLSFTILIIVVIGNMRRHIPSLHRLSFMRKLSFFFGSLFLLVFITPLFSLLRVVVLIFRLIVSKVHSFFSTKEVLRISLVMLAIIAFILSNILQFVATFL